MRRRELERDPRRAVKPVLTVLLIASLVSGVFPVAAAWPPWADDGEESSHDAAVDVTWLLEHMGGDLAVVDVRELTDYTAGHLPGAVHLALDPDALESGPAVFSRIGLAGDERIIFYGADALSERAALAFWLAEFSGARRAAVLDGGVAAWTAAGRALSDGTYHADAAAWVTAARTDR
ncbi:MAG: hypothetical protein GF405_02105, partial [Candidatus Eisenbacteria bacterium]|nr:hypothetical protein [Candidatus Eisenbacteria bacterium]